MWAAPLQNTMKTKCHDYFRVFHANSWANVKYILEQDAWQRLPVPRNY